MEQQDEEDDDDDDGNDEEEGERGEGSKEKKEKRRRKDNYENLGQLFILQMKKLMSLKVSTVVLTISYSENTCLPARLLLFSILSNYCLTQ